MQNSDKLEYTGNLEVVEMPIYGASPSNYRRHIQKLPRKAIWVRDADGGEEFLESVTERYTTIQNFDAFRAVSEVAYDKGINLSVQKSTYYRGKTMTNFQLPDESFTVPGDKSPITPGIFNVNDFGGGSSWKLFPGAVSDWCSNGMIMGKMNLADTVIQRHVGNIEYQDIYEMVSRAFNRLSDAVEIIKVTTYTAATTAVTDDDIEAFLKSIEDRTAKKHRDKMAEVVADNVRTLGHSAWGVTQGITEMFHHHMDAPEHGGTKLAWRDYAVDKLLESVGVASKVRATVAA